MLSPTATSSSRRQSRCCGRKRPRISRRARRLWRGSARKESTSSPGGTRPVVLVEGVSDKVALETLALRRGRNLATERVSVVAAGGAQAMGRFLGLYGPQGSDVVVAGLCDAGEAAGLRLALERAGFGRDLDRAGMERLGRFAGRADLQDELVRCLGARAVMEGLAVPGKLGSFRPHPKHPPHPRHP